ncbi:hypothetical protein GCM10023175_37750 [Pseudonocardia xishanensis]|uniref:Antitoxin protein of toxin-antitoxin system n=2 Tax=Pseudonocardia xishanensis TaxID=630995 RepID=A0ABP8RUZ7_9PSEU
MSSDVRAPAWGSKLRPMGFLDKAKDLISQHDDKVDQGLDKAGEAAKQKFAGHEEHIDKGVDFAQQRTGAGDTTAPPPPAPEGEEPPPPPQP